MSTVPHLRISALPFHRTASAHAFAAIRLVPVCRRIGHHPVAVKGTASDPETASNELRKQAKLRPKCASCKCRDLRPQGRVDAALTHRRERVTRSRVHAEMPASKNSAVSCQRCKTGKRKCLLPPSDYVVRGARLSGDSRCSRCRKWDLDCILTKDGRATRKESPAVRATRPSLVNPVESSEGSLFLLGSGDVASSALSSVTKSASTLPDGSSSMRLLALVAGEHSKDGASGSAATSPLPTEPFSTDGSPAHLDEQSPMGALAVTADLDTFNYAAGLLQRPQALLSLCCSKIGNFGAHTREPFSQFVQFDLIGFVRHHSNDLERQ